MLPTRYEGEAPAGNNLTRLFKQVLRAEMDARFAKPDLSLELRSSRS